MSDVGFESCERCNGFGLIRTEPFEWSTCPACHEWLVVPVGDSNLCEVVEVLMERGREKRQDVLRVLTEHCYCYEEVNDPDEDMQCGHEEDLDAWVDQHLQEYIEMAKLVVRSSR